MTPDLTGLGTGSDDPVRLRFDSQDDALNFARDSVKRGNDWLATQRISPLKDYIEGRVHLVVNCRPGPKAQEFDLVFRRVPVTVTNPAGAIDLALFDADPLCHHSLPHWDNHAMRIGVPYAVQSPQQVIPSLVWLESHKERVNFWWVSRKPFAAEFSCNASAVSGEREAGVCGSAPIDHQSASVQGVIERIPEVSGGVFCDDADFHRQIGSESDLVDLLACIRVHIDNTGVRLCVEESAHTRGSVFNLFACVAD